MSDEDKLPQDGTNPDENLELEPELEDTEDVDALKDTIEKDRIAKQQILARAKKAEAELKALKEKAEATQVTSNLSSEDVEVSILKAQKTSNDEIAYLKKLAKINGTSIIDAQSDEIYISWKANMLAKEKSENAKLGASRGSSSAKKEKTINSSGLSDEEHKALWKEQNG